MKKANRKWGLISIALLLAMTVGCTSSSSSPGSGATSNDKGNAQAPAKEGSDKGATATAKKTITITYRDDGIGEKGVLYKWIKDVASRYPNQEVEIKPTPIQASEGDYFAKIALALKSKDTAPDIVTEDTFMLNSDASAGFLEPLDDRLKGWEDWSNGSFIEAMKKGVTASDGKIYGVPYNTDSRGL